MAQDGATGYLAPGAFDILTVLPPAPKPGDARATADRAIFRATRSLQDTPRWQMAVNDVDETPRALMRDFSCAADIVLTPANAPRTTELIERAVHDTARETSIAKNFYKRQRPFRIDAGAICQPASDLPTTSYDYPSGHTTRGWTWATLLSQIVPARASQILSRGRAYGESRTSAASIMQARWRRDVCRQPSRSTRLPPTRPSNTILPLPDRRWPSSNRTHQRRGPMRNFVPAKASWWVNGFTDAAG